MNAEIEESEGEEASDSDVDEELYVQLAGSKSEEEVDDEVMCRPALVPRGGRRWRGGMVKRGSLLRRWRVEVV